MTLYGEVQKIFPQRGSLCLHRLLDLVKFACSRCSLDNTSKLVGCVGNTWAEPLCNGCYGSLLCTSEKYIEAL